MGNANERIYRIMETIKENNGASVRELASKLNVTEMTIRRDVRKLKDMGFVKNVSGAILPTVDDEKFYSDYTTIVHESKFSSEKIKIGKMAAGFIEPNDIVYIDIGTTAVKIIDAMEQMPDVTVVCSTINALECLQRKGHDRFCLTGGNFEQKAEMLVSSKGIEMLKQFAITKAFISAAGVNTKFDVTCVNGYEVDYKKVAMERAMKKYLVVDSSKFGAVRMNCFAKLEDFDAVITDKKLSDEWMDKIRELGLEIYDC